MMRWFRGMFIRVVFATSLVLTLGYAAAQPVAGSVESGLQELAQAIVNKSAQNDADSIAVLPFPNSDGSCNVLSTYLADELIQSLFTVAGGKLKIIERSQLEALLREVKIGEGGLLNPATTQKLGNLSGVKALALGTVTVIGDHIRINARLISTSSGQTVSAAAVSIARNGEIDGLLQQQIGSSSGICGNTAIVGSESASDTGAGAPAPESGAVPATPSATHEGVTFTVQNVSRSQDKKTVSVVIAATDKLKTPILAAMVYPKPSLLDDQADLADVNVVNGIQVCMEVNRFTEADWCSRNFPVTRWTTLSPAMPTMLLMRFTGQLPIQGNRISIAASILVSPVGENDQVKPGTAKLVSLSLANVPISGQRPAP